MNSRAAALPPHLSGTAVSAAADSELSAPERARVLSHLSRCAACRGRLVTELATKDLVHSLGLGAPRPPSDLNRSLVSLGDAPTAARPVRTPVRTQRSGAIGVLSAVGLSVGLAAAAVVPVAAATSPAPARTVRSQPAAVRAGSAVQQPGSAGAATVVLPAAFTTGGGSVAAVRGPAPADAVPTGAVPTGAAPTDAAPTDAAPLVRQAALVLVEALMVRLETLAGH